MGLPGAPGLGLGVSTPGLKGFPVWVHALGCRTSLCEGEFLAGELEARGASLVRDLEGARAAVVATCSVTGEADRKCRQLLRRARRTLGEAGVLAVCGCWAQAAGAEAARELGVDILAGNRGRLALLEALESQVREGRAFLDLRPLAPVVGWEELPLKGAPLLHTRAFVKVQDGCDHFCSYCVIPFLRGGPVSRPLENILAEVRRLVEGGCREAVLTGINLGSYGREIGTSLAELVRALGGVPGLERLRLGSLEPFSLDEGLLDALAENPAFCPHLHLPLQSGDDEVLALMRRGYGADAYVRLCEAARRKLGGDLHISSDILVGFPGETESAFQNTLALMRRAGLGRAHVFPFSPRRGALAARMPEQVDPRAKAERAAEAGALGAELLSRYAGRFIGEEVEVLVEGPGREAAGHTPHFLEARLEIAPLEVVSLSPGTVIRLRVEAEREGRLEGCLISDTTGAG